MSLARMSLARIALIALALVSTPALAGRGLSWTAKGEPPAEVKALLAEVSAFPQDYGAHARLAAAATDAGDPALALAAWQVAEALSDGNIESTAAQVPLWLQLGEGPRARSSARDAIAADPSSAIGPLWLAVAWNTDAGPWAPAVGFGKAKTAATHAVSLDPASSSARCALAYARWGLGDERGARRAFADAYANDDRSPTSCRAEVPDATAPLIASTYVSGVAHKQYRPGATMGPGPGPTLDWRGGGVLIADVEGGYNEDLSFGATAKLAWVAPRIPDANGKLMQQDELWGRVIATSGGTGALGTAALIYGGNQTSPGLVAGARGWATKIATLRADVALSRMSDANTTQAGLGLRLPALPWLDLDGGVAWSSQTVSTASAGATPQMQVGTTTGHGSTGEVRFHQGTTSLSVGGTLGTQLRPIHLDSSTFWNLEEPVIGSGHVQLSLQPKGWDTSLFAGYEVLHLESDVAWTHALTIGVHSARGGQ